MGWAEACGLALRSDCAGASIEARLRGTAVQRPVAVPAHVAWRARAGVVVNPVHAGGAVCTWVAGALVDVDLTAHPCEAQPTAAHSDVTLDHAVPTCEKKRADLIPAHKEWRNAVDGTVVLPLVHCSEVHLSTFFSQLSPVYPAGHSHRYFCPLPLSLHLPPWKHGLSVHVSILCSHCGPSNPFAHTHL